MVQYEQKICTVSGTQAGRHEEGLTFIRVIAWLARALWVQDRLFVTQDAEHKDTKKS